MATKKVKHTTTTQKNDAGDDDTEKKEKLNLNNPVVAFNVLANSLNMANTRGVFSLSESHIAYEALNSVAGFINSHVEGGL